MTSGGRKLAVAFVLVGGLGCGGQLPGSEGDPAPTTLAALDGEGLPLVAALPQASGSCAIGSPPSRVVETARCDAATRTFTTGTLYWKLDERGRPVEHGQTDGAWRRLMTRDGQGVLTALTHELQGAPAADSVSAALPAPDPGPAPAPLPTVEDADSLPAGIQGRLVHEQAWTPFASVGEVVLHHPSSRVERVGFHE